MMDVVLLRTSSVGSRISLWSFNVTAGKAPYRPSRDGNVRSVHNLLRDWSTSGMDSRLPVTKRHCQHRPFRRALPLLPDKRSSSGALLRRGESASQ